MEGGDKKKSISWAEGPGRPDKLLDGGAVDKKEEDSISGSSSGSSSGSKSNSSSGSGSSNDDDDDDVDKEEEEGKISELKEVKGIDKVDVEKGGVAGGGHLEKDVIRPRRESQRREEDESSVDQEEREGRNRRRSHRRSSVQQERWGIVRGKLRRSLEIPDRLSPSVWFSKETFYQQRLPIVWQPIWNCRTVGRLLLILSIITLPLALYLFIVQNRAHEHRFEFGEECKSSRNYLRLIRSVCVFCGGLLNPHCSKVIHIPEDMKTPVYLYYELEGFHQNHRMIAKSVDNDQLYGKIFTSDEKPIEPSENCGDYSKDENGKIYFPCGQLANLMYNDAFSLATASGDVVPLRTHGIAHSVLKNLRFRNPSTVSSKDYMYKKSFKDHFVRPKSWTKEMYSEWWKGGGMENERFINWMNPSSLAHLRKLYAVIDNVPKCNAGVFCKGNYTMNIEYRFDVDQFGGSKAFVLATTTFFGGRNFALPILIGSIGLVELILGLLLLQLDQMAEAMNRYRRRRSSAKRHSRQQPRRTMRDMDVEVPPPPPPSPRPRPSPSKSISSAVAVTKIPITNEPRPGPSSRASLPPPPPTAEGLKRTDSKLVSTLFWNPISPQQSREVLPDDFNDFGEGERGEEEEEEDGGEEDEEGDEVEVEGDEEEEGDDEEEEETAEEQETGSDGVESSSGSSSDADSVTSVQSKFITAAESSEEEGIEADGSSGHRKGANRDNNEGIRKRR